MSDLEAYIPLAEADHERIRSLAAEVKRRLSAGAEFADGGWVTRTEEDE